MSSKYNLNELAGQDYFEMDLDNFIYRMKYPSANDVLDLDKLGSELEEDNLKLEQITSKLLEEPDKQKRAELTKEASAIKSRLDTSQNSMLDWATQYITPEDKTAPDFKKTVMSKSVKYLLVFINIISEELK